MGTSLREKRQRHWRAVQTALRVLIVLARPVAGNAARATNLRQVQFAVGGALSVLLWCPKPAASASRPHLVG